MWRVMNQVLGNCALDLTPEWAKCWNTREHKCKKKKTNIKKIFYCYSYPLHIRQNFKQLHIVTINSVHQDTIFIWELTWWDFLENLVGHEIEKAMGVKSRPMDRNRILKCVMVTRIIRYQYCGQGYRNISKDFCFLTSQELHNEIQSQRLDLKSNVQSNKAYPIMNDWF